MTDIVTKKARAMEQGICSHAGMGDFTMINFGRLTHRKKMNKKRLMRQFLVQIGPMPRYRLFIPAPIAKHVTLRKYRNQKREVPNRPDDHLYEKITPCELNRYRRVAVKRQ